MATPKKPTPKVKITGKVAPSRPATGTKSVTRGGSMAQSPKIVDRKPAAKKAKTTVYKPKQPSLASQASKAAGKIVGRAKTVAREVRDIPTAVGTVVRATAAGKPKSGTNTPLNKQAQFAKYTLKQQLKEVKSAAQKGTKGTAAVQYGKERTKRK